MKAFKKLIIIFITFIVILQFTACSSGGAKGEVLPEKNKINFSEVMALSENMDKEKLYSVTDGGISNIASVSNVESLNFNKEKNIIVYLKRINSVGSLVNNYVEIDNNGKVYKINTDYSYDNVILSPDGNYVALRSFSKDDLSSAKGLQVYSTSSGKKVSFDNNTLVSGALYQWTDKDTLTYYGIEAGNAGYGAIFSYNFSKNNRNKIFDKFDGYCTFFAELPSGSVLYGEGNKSNMYYYDAANFKVSNLLNPADNIYTYVLDGKNGFVYFLGENTGDNQTELFKFDVKGEKVTRITYDFPNVLDKNSGIYVNKQGEVYFCGKASSNDATNNIYVYKPSDASVSLISSDNAENYYILNNGSY